MAVASTTNMNNIVKPCTMVEARVKLKGISKALNPMKVKYSMLFWMIIYSSIHRKA